MIANKAGLLEWLAPRITRGRVLPLLQFSAGEWRRDRTGVLGRLLVAPFASQRLIVRSSAVGEDSSIASEAGRYTSIRDVLGSDELAHAIDRVIASYDDDRDEHIVLVQPLLSDLVASGVVFTAEPSSGAPYLIVNYRDGTDTSAVTSGRANNLKTFYCWRDSPPPAHPMLAALRALAAELESLLHLEALDFEFAYTTDAACVLFQVRPLVLRTPRSATPARQHAALQRIASRMPRMLGPQPHLPGARTVFGVMPDWNPAEIIGVRPKPLALSLYCDLVTDRVWAEQRFRYGYRDLRDYPLIVELHGLPYVDVRVSFNSFIPADVDSGLAARLVDHDIARLVSAPELHDKIEFEIALSCYTFDLSKRLDVLPRESFTSADREALTNSLRALTNRIVHRDDGLWRADVDRVAALEQRQAALAAAQMDPLARLSRSLEDGKQFGTLSFAGLARTAFIATEWLRSLVACDVLSDEDVSRFMASLDSVSTVMARDLRNLPRGAFLARYGHLRPGTYDITSPRYDETPDRYFEWAQREAASAERAAFTPSTAHTRAIARLLDEHRLDLSADRFFEFVRDAIRHREHAKFVFTRSVSDALALFSTLGLQHGFSLEDLSFANVAAIRRLCDRSAGGPERVRDVLAASIARGREKYSVTRQLALPPLITEADQIWQFHQPPTEPNFITQKEAVAAVCSLESESLDGRIVALLNADPGFDWIFSRKIAGFVTAFGGANSHMAVRACELGLPAVIGAGEPLYHTWAQAHRLRIDCLNRQVQILA
jgi:glutamine kinase